MDKIKIQKLKPMKLAYIEHIGKYDKVPYDKYVPRLYEWAKESYPNCVMWYGLSIARWIKKEGGIGGLGAGIAIAALVEMLEHVNSD